MRADSVEIVVIVEREKKKKKEWGINFCLFFRMDDFGSKEDPNFLYVKGEKKLFNSTILT